MINPFKTKNILERILFDIAFFIGIGVYAVLGAMAGQAENLLLQHLLLALAFTYLTAFSTNKTTHSLYRNADHIYQIRIWSVNKLPSTLSDHVLLKAVIVLTITAFFVFLSNANLHAIKIDSIQSAGWSLLCAFIVIARLGTTLLKRMIDKSDMTPGLLKHFYQTKNYSSLKCSSNFTNRS